MSRERGDDGRFIETVTLDDVLAVLGEANGNRSVPGRSSGGSPRPTRRPPSSIRTTRSSLAMRSSRPRNRLTRPESTISSTARPTAE
jgi:hypothetical protein